MARRLYRRLKQLGRAATGWDVYPKVDRREQTEAFGRGYGEWRILPALLGKDSVVYTFGIGTDITFDLALIERFGMRVHGFDPTPMVADWLKSQRLPDRFVFHPVGIGQRDETLWFSPPSDPNFVSHTIVEVKNARHPKIPLNVRSLPSLMAELGHGQIDLVKLDVEGSEYGVIDSLVECDARPRQLLVEFHHRWASIGVEKTRAALATLRGMGYEVYAISDSGEEYSLVFKERASVKDN
jgi:FkbM family methyltransferase